MASARFTQKAVNQQLTYAKQRELRNFISRYWRDPRERRNIRFALLQLNLTPLTQRYKSDSYEQILVDNVRLLAGLLESERDFLRWYGMAAMPRLLSFAATPYYCFNQWSCQRIRTVMARRLLENYCLRWRSPALDHAEVAMMTLILRDPDRYDFEPKQVLGAYLPVQLKQLYLMSVNPCTAANAAGEIEELACNEETRALLEDMGLQAQCRLELDSFCGPLCR